MAKHKVAVGIDLGTTHSCVAVYRNGKVTVIHNDKGNMITPSYVGFTSEERHIGDDAKDFLPQNPYNTVFQAKRLIGRHYNDQVVQDHLDKFPFEIVDTNGSPYVKVMYKDQEKIFAPEEISGMILSKLKRNAEDYLGVPVEDAVITVPAYFSDSQRQATIDAGKIAGLNVLKIINEPTAAALAYGIDKKFQSDCNVLVFDLGGGTFDVSIMTLSNKLFQVRKVGGNTCLGGADFDNKLVEHFSKLIKRKHGIDISENKRAMCELQASCEILKKRLSSNATDKIYHRNLSGIQDFEESMTRARLEDLCSPFFRKSIEIAKETLVEAKMTIHDINIVLAVGGSTRIPKIQEMLSDLFQGKRLALDINPDEAVAQGAAIQAAILSGERTIDEFSLLDVIPLSLSVALHDDTVRVILDRNSKTPVSHTSIFSTVEDYQKAATFRIYEGERKTIEHNTFLGSFTLENIQVAKKGVPVFELTYRVDENGILHCTAVDKKMNSSNSITITENKGRLNKEEMEAMAKTAKKMNHEEEIVDKKKKLRNDLESFCLEQILSVQGNVSSSEPVDSASLRIVDVCNETLEWLEDNPNAEISVYERKLRILRDTCTSVRWKSFR